MQNRFLYPKSTQVEAPFPFIESIAISIPHHTQQVAWHPLQQSRDSLWHPSQEYRNINFSKAKGWKIRAPHIVWRGVLILCLRMKRSAIFPQARQEEFSLRNMHVRGTMCFMPQAKWTPRCSGSKEGQISLQRLNACWSFISQDEKMSESPVETIQKALGLHLISKRGLTSFGQLESHVDFTASNVDDAWQFLNIVRNPNITVSNRKWSSVSLLTSRSLCIFLRSLA